MQRTCCVSFRWHGDEYSNATMGRSLFDAAASALEFFCAPQWKGPRPRRNTILLVTTMAISGGITLWRGGIEGWVGSRGVPGGRGKKKKKRGVPQFSNIHCHRLPPP